MPRATLATTMLALAVLLAACKPAEVPFKKIDGVWHYHDQAIAAADSRTFEPLDARYAKDAARVFFADTYRDGREYYSIRHARVRLVADADAATFRTLGSGYARDRAAVYFEGARFPVRDVDTFELLDYGFARDLVRGYWHQAEVPGSDGPTFAALDTHHAKDRAAVYHVDFDSDGGARKAVVKTRTLADADPATFQLLDSGYAKDVGRVYHRGLRVPAADASSFRTIVAAEDAADAEDGNARYRDGRRIGARDGGRAVPAAR